MLKSLTGGDSMTVELKNGRERPEIIGNFNVIITSNSRLIKTTKCDPCVGRYNFERRVFRCFELGIRRIKTAS